MRKLLVGMLGWFRKISLFILKLRGKTLDDVASERIVSGKAWEEFCDTLKAAGASRSPVPGLSQ